MLASTTANTSTTTSKIQHSGNPEQIKQYVMMEQIAEGQFGKVNLVLFHGKVYALKQTSSVSPNECLIHRSINHENIIRLYDSFQLGPTHYMLMEYAACGELFDKILPDIGVDEELAHFYFRQLISGVEYLHNRGISHRDLKPENLLIDEHGNLKICDFGLSTVFKHRGQKRRLTTICGTKPYIAPEVMFGNYDGEMVDIWSCGIILFVLLVGNTPWDEPSETSSEFCNFVMQQKTISQKDPWNRISPNVLELILGMLNVYEERRFTLSHIKSHRWFLRQTTLLAISSPCDAALDRLLSQMNAEDTEIFCSQQMMDMASQQHCYNDTQREVEDSSANMVSFSQPVEYLGTYGYHGKVNFSQPDKGSTSKSASVTRFFTQNEHILTEISSALTDFLVTFNHSQNSIHFSTVDRRKCPLNGEIHVQSASNDMWMVHFRRINGDPLEFRRFYMAIKDVMSENFVVQTQQ